MRSDAMGEDQLIPALIVIDAILNVWVNVRIGRARFAGSAIGIVVFPVEAAKHALGTLIASGVVHERANAIQLLIDNLNDVDRVDFHGWLAIGLKVFHTSV